MKSAAKILYGEFPRTVASTSPTGGLKQFFIHSEGEFDLWFHKLRSERNLYSSICRFRSDMRPILDTFPFDFDSPMKEAVFENEMSDREKIERMREDRDLAEEVLGEVWYDAQKLMAKCRVESIPAIAVFSGLGVHVHLLYQEEVNPIEQKVSTSQWLVDECNLNTHDIKIIPDVRRVLRVPNSQRFSDGEAAGIWCIPMTEMEVINNDIHDVLERTSSPKNIDMKERYKERNRPEMQIYEGYKEIEEDTVGTVPLDDAVIETDMDGVMEELVKDCIPLPCVRERFFSSNPDHLIRFNGTVLLYQSGFTPGEVREIISRIGWIDYDPEITRKMTEQIYRKRYSENTCEKLQSRGLCVFGPDFEEYDDNLKSCEAYKWSSGKSIYGD